MGGLSASRPAQHERPHDIADLDLRRYQRLLRPMRWDEAHATSLHGAVGNDTWIEQERDAVRLAAFDIPKASRRENSPAWGVNLLLFTGCAALFIGMALLATANMLLHPSAWRWGFAVALGSEGLLTIAVAAMAMRLWRNSRRLNRQLAAVDQRLCEMQSTLAQSTNRVTTSSLRTALRRLDLPNAVSR
jgi:hypothetical protein